MIVLLYTRLIYSLLSEQGYIWSVGKKRFVTYEESTVRLADKSEMPKSFFVQERPDLGQNNKTIYIGSGVSEKVLDFPGMGRDLLLWPFHGAENQRIMFEAVPNGMIKILIRNHCGEAFDRGVVTEVECKSYDSEKDQYFRWVPYKFKEHISKYLYGRRRGDEDSNSNIYRKSIQPIHRRGGDFAEFPKNVKYRFDEDQELSSRDNTYKGSNMFQRRTGYDSHGGFESHRRRPADNEVLYLNNRPPHTTEGCDSYDDMDHLICLINGLNGFVKF